MAFAEEGNTGRSPDTRPAARGSGMPVAAGDHRGARPGAGDQLEDRQALTHERRVAALTEACCSQLW
jgi:hypothetical protein